MKSKYILLAFITSLIATIGSAQLSVEHFEPPTFLESRIDYEFKIKYSSDRDIKIFFEFKKAPDQGFGFKSTNVGPATDQIITVPITARSLPTEGNDYFIRAYFFENNAIVDGTVTDIRDIEVIINVNEDALDFAQPPLKLFSQTSYNFDLAYEATQKRDLVFEFWSASGLLGTTRKTVPGGANTETMQITLIEAPSIGDGYFYRAFIVPTGEEISAATASTDTFAGVSVFDFLGNPCSDEIEEKDGLVVIEAEDFDITGTDWQRRTEKTQYTGISYLEWLGNDFFGDPGNGVIEAKIKITKTGKYRFQWRNRVGFGSNGTEHNDSWLKFPDVPAEDFYGEKGDGSRTYPRGSGLMPNPAGASGDGWFKIYANSLDWNFNASTGDNADGRPVYVEFDSPGIYTLQISGRSKNHLIDRIVLHNDASNPTDLDNMVSNCTNVLGISDTNLKDSGIIVYPNPVGNMELFVNGLAVGDKIDIFSMTGQVAAKEIVVQDAGIKSINTSGLVSGIYFLRVDKKGVQKIVIK